MEPLWTISNVPLRHGWELWNDVLYWTITYIDGTTVWILGLGWLCRQLNIAIEIVAIAQENIQ